MKGDRGELLKNKLDFHNHFKALAGRKSKLGDEGIREIENVEGRGMKGR